MKHGTIPKVCIVKGTHRYEKGAHMLGDPLVEELGCRGIVAVLHNVPPYAADTGRDAPDAYMTFRKARKRWWRTLAKSEKCPVFTLHSYPYDRQDEFMSYGGCRKIGDIKSDDGAYGVYIFESVSLAKRLLRDPIGTVKHLLHLWRKGASPWEDGTLYHTHMLEVPAIPDRSDASGLTVDLDRTIAAGFTSDRIVEIAAKGIANLVGKQ